MQLRNLATVLVQPRQTMRRILDHPPDRMVIPLVLLALVPACVRDADPAAIRQAGAIVAAVLACFVVATLVLFYLYGWVAAGVGRLFEGAGSAREVRSALAWGLVPIIGSLVYVIPEKLLLRGQPVKRMQFGRHTFSFDEGLFAHGCGVAFLFLLLKAIVFVWFVYVASQTLAEAHRFSGWRGFATLVLGWLAPAVIVLAAVLAMKT